MRGVRQSELQASGERRARLHARGEAFEGKSRGKGEIVRMKIGGAKWWMAKEKQCALTHGFNVAAIGGKPESFEIGFNGEDRKGALMLSPVEAAQLHRGLTDYLERRGEAASVTALAQLCKALGWQGGTTRQVVQAVASQRSELEGLRLFKRSVDEALNSGDGSYRP